MTEYPDLKNKYSIIISYRNREEHLSILLPRLKELFSDKDYEIIIAEQDNDEKFQKNSLYNIAVSKTNGNILIFHDVDYYPTDNVNYYTEINVPLYPVRRVMFLDINNQPRQIADIPKGYVNFINDVGDHSGGVFVLSKHLFYKMNGLNPYYKGWGKEDDDTRDRLRLLGYQWKRNSEGLFYALYHEDNKPDDTDADFINNHILLSNLSNTLNFGYKDVTAEVLEEEFENNIRWLKIKKFQYENRSFSR
jgi:predicted glycosyltransferase involved in capsule biosynthesis